MDHEEVEWHFEIDQPHTIENWLREHPLLSGFSVRPEAAKEPIDTYYDTEDWRFYRAGYALRVRRDGKNVEATMKSFSPAEDGVKRRREISAPLKRGDAKALLKARGPVGEHLRLLAGARDLRPLFEIRNRRRVFTLRPGEEETAAEAGGSAREIVVDATGGIHRKATEGYFSEEVVVDAAGGIHRRSEEGLFASAR
jgi:inorganic triphosphatase YgiF